MAPAAAVAPALLAVARPLATGAPVCEATSLRYTDICLRSSAAFRAGAPQIELSWRSRVIRRGASAGVRVRARGGEDGGGQRKGKQGPSFGDQILDYIEGGPKLRRWYGAADTLPRDGADEDEEGEETEEEGEEEEGGGDAVLVTDADSDTGQMVVLQLILARRRVRVLVKDPKEATAGFGPYVQPIAGSVAEQAAVRAALRGSQAVIVTGRLGSLAQLLQGSKVEHVVLVSQLGASSRPSGLAGLLWSASLLAAAADAEAALAAAAVAAGGDGERGAAGEARRRGFGCTVVRGGKVVDEPGRQRGLLLGQGNTMKGSVSREDLAAVVAAALAVPPPSQHRRIIEVVNSDTPRDSNDGSDFLERIAGLSTEPIII